MLVNGIPADIANFDLYALLEQIRKEVRHTMPSDPVMMTLQSLVAQTSRVWWPSRVSAGCKCTLQQACWPLGRTWFVAG